MSGQRSGAQGCVGATHVCDDGREVVCAKVAHEGRQAKSEKGLRVSEDFGCSAVTGDWNERKTTKGSK